MADLTLRRRLSEPTFATNIALNGVVTEVFTESVIADVLWRWEDEIDMEPQFLISTLAGKTIQVPFDLKGRDIRLFLRGRTSEGFASATNISDYVQTVFTAPATPEEELEETTLRPLFDFYNDAPTTGTAYENLYNGTIEAGTFVNLGDKVIFEGSGITAANANAKILGLEIDGNSTAEANDVFNNKDWTVDGIIIRDGSDTLRYQVEIIVSSEDTFIDAGKMTGIDFDADISLALRGRSPSNIGDITAQIFTAWRIPAAQTVALPDGVVTFLGVPVTFLGEYVTFNPTGLVTFLGEPVTFLGEDVTFNP